MCLVDNSDGPGDADDLNQGLYSYIFQINFLECKTVVDYVV